MSESETSGDTIVGQVKWFSNQLNYGFLTVLDKGEHNGIDVFVHQTNICPQVSNYRTLTQGEYVSFILTHNEGEKHPYHGTNITGYNGGKLMCDFNNFNSRHSSNEESTNRDGNRDGGREGGRRGGRKYQDNKNSS
jgi:cold shock CspA family protein